MFQLGSLPNRFPRVRVLPWFGTWVTLLVALPFASNTYSDEPVSQIDFNRDIRPILSDKCYYCHGPDKSHRKADLRLDDRASAVEDIGVIVPGQPEKSELVARITSDDEFTQMPPPDANKELTPAQIDLLKKWIASGAAYEKHWSHIPPQRSPLPTVKQTAWPNNEIDVWILARLEAKGLSPSPVADRGTLIRRLSFDLIGLPPTPEEVEAFVNDERPDAYERLVDRLLASPHFGERMAIYWLDLVRYADTVGYHGDQGHNATPYRDYVIAAFNADMPFDRFTREQLAGDLLPDASTDQIVASAYNRLLQTTHEGGAQDKEYLAKYLADRVRNVSGVWLAGTVGCAECHDHKFDPYTQKDFYSLGAFFADVEEQGAFSASNSDPTQRRPEMPVLPAIYRSQATELAAQVTKLKGEIAALGKSQEPDAKEKLEAAKTALTEAEKQLVAINKHAANCMITKSVEPRTIRVLARGDWMDESGAVVQPAVPEFLPGINKPEDARATRLDLANWLTQPDHPMTSRVFMNRLWYLTFGEGLTSSLADFGAQGETPMHPELLDMLAVEFVESGWDVKAMLRKLVLSQTYQQASLPRTELTTADPDNRLLARQSRYRLPAEMIRDNSLVVSGLLVDEIGGVSAKPYQPARYYQHLNFPQRSYQPSMDDQQWRRGVYTHWQRMFLHPAMLAFDAPTREECTAKRPISNTPKAALAMLNDPSQVEAARNLAARILTEKAAGETVEDRVGWAFQTVVSRPPSKQEAEIVAAVYQKHYSEYEKSEDDAKKLLATGISPQAKSLDPAELAAWTSVARTLLNLNEAIMRN